jgi:hypothetical protein
MIRNILITIIIIRLLIGSATAQEKLYSLEFNALVKNKYQQFEKSADQNYPDTTFITLPFFDDFSRITVWPSPERWADNYAFINNDYARNAPTIGVATLDAIDENGALYSNAGPYQFEADHLTSQPIRLDSIFSPLQRAIKKSDSLYLSFYYQPQGRGSMPSKKDSLLLEFHSPVEFDPVFENNDTIMVPRWHTVWSSAGGVQVDTFAIQQHGYFKEVVVPISDSSLYYKKGFRFRFRNYASLANSYVPDWQSNGDQWNIDVVYLNTGRSIRDTVIKDVAFADRPPSMLKRYEAMPYDQYKANFVEEMKDTLDIKISNLDNASQNLSYGYTVQKDSQTPFNVYSGGNHSLGSYQSIGYSTWQPFARPPVDSLYPQYLNQEAVVFNSIHFLTTDPAMSFKGNDTLRYAQIFSNYYAYDDGTAEAGIGLNGASGSYAVRFELNEADTLRGFKIYFNQVRSGAENQYIDLAIWKDSFGKPGQVMKLMSEVTPIYSDSLNTFHTYWFESPYPINADNFPGLIFYAGWQQTSIDNINIGLDRYNDTHQFRFYNVDGTWQMSDDLHAGSLMLRPIIGKVHPLGQNSLSSINSLGIYPNPVSDGWIHCKVPSSWNNISTGQINVAIFNSAGSLVSSPSFTEKMNLESLNPGFYIIKLFNNVTGETLKSKLLVR